MPGCTPFVIATSIDWVDQIARLGKMRRPADCRGALAQRLAGPRHARYLQHYASNFTSDTQRLSRMGERKAAVNAAKTWAKSN